MQNKKKTENLNKKAEQWKKRTIPIENKDKKN